jgi:hypothetical protein
MRIPEWQNTFKQPRLEKIFMGNIMIDEVAAAEDAPLKNFIKESQPEDKKNKKDKKQFSF